MQFVELKIGSLIEMAKKTRMGRISQLIDLIEDLDDNMDRDDTRDTQRLELKTFRAQHMNELLDLRYKDKFAKLNTKR